MSEGRLEGKRKIMQLIIPKPPGQKADPMSSQKIVHSQTNINIVFKQKKGLKKRKY